MKNSHRCPKCQNHQLLEIPQVNDRSGRQDTDEPMYLVSGFAKRQGLLSAMMCRRCGYTEFYVKEPGSVQPVSRAVIEVNGPEGGTPFR